MGPVHTAHYFFVIKGLRGELKTDTLHIITKLYII